MTRRIEYQVDVSAPLDQVWQAWTTEEGARTFFAPECKIDLRVGGAYEMYFDLAAPPGEKGGEGVTILAIQQEKLLSFTWNAPPDLQEVRGQHTHVTLSFQPAGENSTRIDLVHDGWGGGGQWDQALDYFTRAWGEVVLPRLQYRFEHGPVDWEDPPALGRTQK